MAWLFSIGPALDSRNLNRNTSVRESAWCHPERSEACLPQAGICF